MLETGRPAETDETAALDERGLLTLQNNILRGSHSPQPLPLRQDRLAVHAEPLGWTPRYPGDDPTLSSPLSAGILIYPSAEQDDALDELSRAVTSTKHIAIAVDEELDLQHRLLARSLEKRLRTPARSAAQSATLKQRVPESSPPTQSCRRRSHLLSHDP